MLYGVLVGWMAQSNRIMHEVIIILQCHVTALLDMVSMHPCMCIIKYLYNVHYLECPRRLGNLVESMA